MSFQGHIENGVVVFDEPVTIPEGTAVRVEVQGLSQGGKHDPSGFVATMEKIWAGQHARAHIPRSREEIDAEIDRLRNDAEEEMHAVEQLHKECQRVRQESGEQSD